MAFFYPFIQANGINFKKQKTIHIASLLVSLPTGRMEFIQAEKSTIFARCKFKNHEK